jgi:hypothetical protein
MESSREEAEEDHHVCHLSWIESNFVAKGLWERNTYVINGTILNIEAGRNIFMLLEAQQPQQDRDLAYILQHAVRYTGTKRAYHYCITQQEHPHVVATIRDMSHFLCYFQEPISSRALGLYLGGSRSLHLPFRSHGFRSTENSTTISLVYRMEERRVWVVVFIL